MGKISKVLAVSTAILLLSGCASFLTNYDLQPDPTPTVQPTKTPLPTPAPTETPAPALNYWPDGLKVVDVTDHTSRNCTFDMCLFLKLTAVKTCSSITIDGTTYTADDVEVDSFSQDFPKLKKGATKFVEFGTDASYDTEDYVDMDDATCWK
jgi:hypothetical protein